MALIDKGLAVKGPCCCQVLYYSCDQHGCQARTKASYGFVHMALYACKVLSPYVRSPVIRRSVPLRCPPCNPTYLHAFREKTAPACQTQLPTTQQTVVPNDYFSGKTFWDLKNISGDFSWISGDFVLVKIRLILLLRGVVGGWGGYRPIFNITKLKKKRRKKELAMMFTGEGFTVKSRVFESAQKSLLYFSRLQNGDPVCNCGFQSLFFGDKKDPWVLFSFLLERGTVVLMYIYIYF